MVYTIKELTDLLKHPVDVNKWGTDTNNVIRILHMVNQASCSSCAMRRFVRELKGILNKHGDDIAYTPDAYSVGHDKNARIKCPDCVAKHLSEAYILQCEFYQGYTEYLSLIEGHLNQAIAECPIKDTELYDMLQNALRTVIVDRKPDVPLVAYNSQEGSDAPVNSEDAVHHDLTLSGTNICSDNIKSMDSNLIHTAYIILKNNSYTLDKLISLVNEGKTLGLAYGGHMAVVSDMFSMHCPELAQLLRQRRLMIQRCIKSRMLDKIEDIWVTNTDVLEEIDNIMKNCQK